MRKLVAILSVALIACSLSVSAFAEDVASGDTSEPCPCTQRTVEVVDRGRNYIPYPFPTGTYTAKGLTYTDNGDGSITINGTTSGFNRYVFISTSEKLVLPAGKYVIGGFNYNSSYAWTLQTNLDKWAKHNGGEGTFEISEDSVFGVNLTMNDVALTVSNYTFTPYIYRVNTVPACTDCTGAAGCSCSCEDCTCHALPTPIPSPTPTLGPDVAFGNDMNNRFGDGVGNFSDSTDSVLGDLSNMDFGGFGSFLSRALSCVPAEIWLAFLLVVLCMIVRAVLVLLAG